MIFMESRLNKRESCTGPGRTGEGVRKACWALAETLA